MRNLLIKCVTEPLIIIIIQFLGYCIVAYNDILINVRTYIAISYRHLLHDFLRVQLVFAGVKCIYFVCYLRRPPSITEHTDNMDIQPTKTKF